MASKRAKTQTADASPRAASGTAPFQQELEALAARLDSLEKAQSVSASDAEKYWAIHHLLQLDGPHPKRGGSVVYAGAVTLPNGGHFRWQRKANTSDILKSDWQSLDRVLSGLAHPIRLKLLKAVVEGKSTKSELEDLDGIGTTGQLYHHLKALEQGGWLRSLERGVYAVPGERVVPLLAILAAASN
jgi:DNA-binding transcriptional ArsR family regulator